MAPNDPCKCLLRGSLALFTVTFLALVNVDARGADAAARAELVEIFEQARALTDPPRVSGIPDYSADVVAQQKESLQELRRRFDVLQPEAWPARDQVDYLLVRAELDMLDYGLYVYRASSRSPNFYLSSISSFGMSSGATLSRLGRLVQQPPPFDEVRAEQILAQMRSIPAILEQAKKNLTEPTVEMSRWALPALANARTSSHNFAVALQDHFPARQAAELVPAAEAMGAALEEFRRWIDVRLPEMQHAQPIGRELYDWILQRIWLLPYDADDILRFGEQEYARYLAFTEFEEARNREVPRPRPAESTAAYAAATTSDELAIREFLEQRDVLTVPAYVGAYRRALMPEYIQAFSLWASLSGYETADNAVVKYAVPENHPYTQTYWEAIMRLDPSTNIFHDGLPGHHFQGVISSRHPSPVRSQRRDRFKSEGWSTYWEETALQLGFYDNRPRSRELIYNFLRLRALRVIIDVKMALGEMSVDDAVSALMTIPMDRRIASEEVDDFFAAPTGGIVYQIGKMQIERLLAERRNDLGEKFNLRQFHDELVASAWVPLELTRFEITGRDENLRRMIADRRPMPRPEVPHR